eukprot:464018_1
MWSDAAKSGKDTTENPKLKPKVSKDKQEAPETRILRQRKKLLQQYKESCPTEVHQLDFDEKNILEQIESINQLQIDVKASKNTISRTKGIDIKKFLESYGINLRYKGNYQKGVISSNIFNCDTKSKEFQVSISNITDSNKYIITQSNDKQIKLLPHNISINTLNICIDLTNNKHTTPITFTSRCDLFGVPFNVEYIPGPSSNTLYAKFKRDLNGYSYLTMQDILDEISDKHNKYVNILHLTMTQLNDMEMSLILDTKKDDYKYNEQNNLRIQCLSSHDELKKITLSVFGTIIIFSEMVVACEQCLAV